MIVIATITMERPMTALESMSWRSGDLYELKPRTNLLLRLGAPMVDTEFVSALRILVTVVPVDLPASQASRVRRAHIEGAAPRVAI